MCLNLGSIWLCYDWILLFMWFFLITHQKGRLLGEGERLFQLAEASLSSEGDLQNQEITKNFLSPCRPSASACWWVGGWVGIAAGADSAHSAPVITGPWRA